jgi:hypothetical protein
VATVEALMKSHLALALASALVAFIPASASAQSQNEEQACMNDAFTVCGHAIPDRDRVAACLAQNINRISAGCRTVMARYSKPGAAPARRGRAYEQQEDRDDRGEQFFRDDGYDRRSRYGRY